MSAWKSVRKRQWVLLSIVASLSVIAVACGSDSTDPVDATARITSTELPSESAAPPAAPSFDVDGFRKLNPLPEIVPPGPENERRLLPQGNTIPIDAIPPIYDPQFVASEESELVDDELVMGVSVNGDSRAYPVGMMRFREMVNDEVGGVPLLVTW